MDIQSQPTEIKKDVFSGWSIYALGSFSIGILFFLFLNIFFSVISSSVFSKGLIALVISAAVVVLGGLGLREIQNTKVRGTWFSVIGIILGSLGLIFSIFLMISAQITGVGNGGAFYEEKAAATNQALVNYVGLIEIYKKKHGSYPETLMKALEENALLNSSMNADQISNLIFTDFFGQPFFYKISDDSASYDVRSVGLDGEYGTDDDITVF